ncbi:hypothetical protein ACFUC1_16205 [Pedococcus sp. NPDC057267]|uniref:hypothetical protein n=1 Tax=Pedococcus sp. NPDC057267 TaxID=3346077 RepID=UPI003629B66C
MSVELADELQRLVAPRADVVAGVLEDVGEVQALPGSRCISWAATSANCWSVTR